MNLKFYKCYEEEKVEETRRDYICKAIDRPSFLGEKLSGASPC